MRKFRGGRSELEGGSELGWREEKNMKKPQRKNSKDRFLNSSNFFFLHFHDIVIPRKLKFYWAVAIKTDIMCLLY